ncbi:MAG: GntR family transcriptional regulator [Desulfobulbaceae bacterium A2]|nr:MAG: GntR family transcriptional regulator [Desulfobulbaceae bacterium A2]
MTLELKPIKARKISDQVFEQIRDLIFRGELKAGQQLTPERELAEMLDVSRTSVRNAINKLVVMGLLEHKQGQGTFVCSPEAWRQRNPLAVAMDNSESTLKDLLEVRLGLECNAVALAAQRAEPHDLEFIAKSIQDMRQAFEDGGLGVEADTSFHMAIAFATKNPFHVYIMKNFYELLFMGIKQSHQGLYMEPTHHRMILDQHTKIFECIQQHAPKAASEAMDQHIHFVIDFFKNRVTS